MIAAILGIVELLLVLTVGVQLSAWIFRLVTGHRPIGLNDWAIPNIMAILFFVVWAYWLRGLLGVPDWRSMGLP